jgi:integrase
MARAATGSIAAETLGDGTLAFRLRFRAAGNRKTVYLHEARACECGCGGGWNERTAAVELENILARVRAGVWTPPQPRPRGSGMPDGAVLSFHEYSSQWLQARIDGVIGEQPIRPSTAAKYRWRIESHLLPFFASYQLPEIDRDLCLAFKAHLLRQSRELRDSIGAGADIRHRNGMRVKPLSPASMRMVIDGLVALLDDAVEDGHIDSNPARGRRMRIKVPKPRRTFLELDELAALIDAASEQDVSLGPGIAPIELGLTAAQVAQLHGQGRTPTQIARQLDLAKSTVSDYLKRLGLRVGRGYVGRRVVVEILGRGGPRASELCELKIGHVRLHDPDGARFRIPDAKTETGIREVQMTPDLVETVVDHLDRLRRMGAPTGPEDYLVPNLRGQRMSYGRVEEIVRDAATRASERLAAQGLPPLPHTTPHTLRRTYISIELLANNFDVKWVMSQVGHADSKMTMDVYAQLQQRAKRDRGARFDKLVRDAREQLLALHKTPREGPIGTANGTEGQKQAPKGLRRRPATGSKPGDLQAVREWAIQDSNLGPLPYQRSALTN